MASLCAAHPSRSAQGRVPCVPPLPCFGAAVLRKARVPEDLLRMWLGHASKSVTDDYVLQIREDPPFRREWAQRVGLGFSIASDERCSTCSTSGVTTPNS